MKRFFFRIINLGIHQTMSFAERKKSRIANGLAAMIVILGLVLSILSLFFPILPLSILLNLSAILGGGITLLFNFWQKHQIARLILILFFIIFLSTFSLFLGEDFGLEYNLFSVMIGIAVFFDRKMYFIPLFILCAIAFIVVKFGFQYVTPIIPPEEARNNYYVNLVFNFILCFWGLYIFKVEHLEYKEVIEGKNKELHKKNEDITASITYAKRIQTAMLPRMEDIKKALPEFFILFKPRDIVSGDFYFFKEIVAPPPAPSPEGRGINPLTFGQGAGGGGKNHHCLCRLHRAWRTWGIYEHDRQ